jgi:hypothetical protein
MEKEIAIYRLLSFMSLADTAAIAEQKTSQGTPLGTELAKAVTDFRTTLKEGGFKAVSELLLVKGMTSALVDGLLPAFTEKERHPGYIASQTLVGFKGGEPSTKAFMGRIILEKFTGAVLQRDQETEAKDVVYYALYYKSDQQKEKVLGELRLMNFFFHFNTQRVFAVQNRNGSYWCTIPHAEVYLRDFYWATKFSITEATAPAHGLPYSPPPAQPNAFLSVGFGVRNDVGVQGRLTFSGAAGSRVRTLSLTTNPTATATEKFDVQGIFLPRPGESPDLFKSFNMMNFVQANISTTDPRQFMTASAPQIPNPSYNYYLAGSGNKTFWENNHQFRYVDVIENMALKVIHNPTHTPQMGRDAYMAIVAGNVIGVQTVPTGSPVPANAKFDMYVHYGYWGERRNIVAKVVLRYRPSQIVGLDATTDDVVLSPASTLAAQHFFYIENGWGGGVNHVNLKTNAGKYLKCWQDQIVADAFVPYTNEQFEIIIP